MSVLLAIPGCLFGLAVVYFSLVLRYVPSPNEWVVELNLFRKGTIKIIWKAGLHFLWFPIRPFMFVRNRVPMNDQTIVLRVGQTEGEGSEGKVELEDCSVAIIIQLVFKVNDSVKATYNVDNYRSASINKIEALVRQFLGGKKLDDALKESTKREVTDKSKDEANGVVADWGVEIVDVSIIDFIPDPEDDAARRKVLAAKKEAEAAVLKAEGDKRVTVLGAEGKKKARVLEAEGNREAGLLEGTGQAKQIKVIASECGIDALQVIAYLVSGKYFTSLEKATIIATSEGGKLNFPVDIGAAILGLTKAMGKGGGASAGTTAAGSATAGGTT